MIEIDGHRKRRWDIGKWLMLCLLLCACSSGEEGEVAAPTTLSIYVYAPDNPMLTRGDVDWVKDVLNEGRINTLQIWVFEHENGDLVGYFVPASTTDLNNSKQAVYQMTVTPQFAHDKPNVDVYVLANVTGATCGCSFDESTTRAELEKAKLKYVDNGHDYFGLLGTMVTEVPSAGLPITGVLRDQPVTGESPVLRVGDGALATVRMVRAVSKVRFVFSQQNNEEAVLRIKGVSLTGDEVLPKQEYLFLDQAYTGREYRIDENAGYETGGEEGIPVVGDLGVVATNADPLYYVYTNQSAQEYENLILWGITQSSVRDAELTPAGRYYLRETDKKLTGKIRYTINNGEERTASFSMHEAGDFSRNHTWIVYAFYGTTTLEVLVVKVRSWVVSETVTHEVYNW